MTTRCGSIIAWLAVIEIIAMVMCYGYASSMTDPYAGVGVLGFGLRSMAAVSVLALAVGIGCLAADAPKPDQPPRASFRVAIPLHLLLCIPGLWFWFHA
ncbi:hypothetical protein C5615_02085 [Burkholderia cepacia]|uniref:Uncharacterized protein n=1 Tax=Burkholderia cepacia TaxID=292 RepID=A0A2S8J3T4_BURCE|nr:MULTISPECIES: hypothetical protein [Burkholderia]PQP21726.1 hypothetical protein C5615_02085 [Burkholderia cepacia]TDA46713.1 hypothetical protein EVG18_14795 [Burkholderia pyrrocinia]HDR9505371.1 hypothetical protein [Burkholderia cepacia]